jgi:hypothetical protein
MDSILAVDCGSAMTTVALIGKVGGHYRFVAQGESISTHASPWNDVTVGVRSAVEHIEWLVGRCLLTSEGELIRPQNSKGDGVDTVVAVSSAGMPLRVALVGLTLDLSLGCARQAMRGSAAEIISTFRWDRRADMAEPLNEFVQLSPDVVVTVGGFDGGATKPLVQIGQLLALYAESVPGPERPLFLYAGNVDAAGAFVAALDDSAKVIVLPNVLPQFSVENSEPLRRAVDRIYREQRLSRLAGMRHLNSWAERSIVAAHRSFTQVVRYVAERYGLRVVGLDIGSASTVVAVAAGRKTDAVGIEDEPTRKFPAQTIGSNLGIGQGIGQALAEIPLDHILRWMPVEMDEPLARDMLWSKRTYPASVAETSIELYLEYALAREIVRLAKNGADIACRPQSDAEVTSGQWDLVIGTGRLISRAPSPGLAALLLLDSFEPRGVSKLAVDVSGVASTLGAVAAAAPLAAVDVVEYDAFLNLGTLVAPFGISRKGEMVLELRVSYDDGRVVEEAVDCGTIKVIPLKPGERASLELYPARYVDVGLGLPGESARAEAEGGVLGIIIDARGRPLQLPEVKNERQDLIASWLRSLGVKDHFTESSRGSSGRREMARVA